jgi:hypothetical protein
VVHIEDSETLSPGTYVRARVVRGLPNSLIARVADAASGRNAPW